MKIIVIICLILLISLTGCSKDEKEDVIQSVVEQVFRAPDDDVIELINKMDEEMDTIAENDGDYSLEDSEFFQWLEKTYHPYLTDECYEKLISRRIPYKYHLEMDTLESKLEVEEVEITQSKTSSKNYDFIIKLNYEPADGEMKNIEVVGTAQFTEGDNKISYIKFFDDDLYRKFEEK